MQQETKPLKRREKPNKFAIGIFLFLFHIAGYAQLSVVEAFPALTFTSPVDLQHAGDNSNRIFLVEQEGIIRVFENSPSVTESKVFLDIRDRVKISGEMGLLGLAFHPDYENNGYFYVNYTTGEPVNRSIISRFRVSSDPDVAERDSELRFIRLDQPEENHNGGQLAFGPDGYLYIAFGDGGGAGDPGNRAQNRTNLFGSILRIDVDRQEGTLQYASPDDNPFKSNTSDYREEIYAYGFRNPWRFSFDTITGTLWAADVGQSDYEEINIVQAGGNYGWRLKEGSHCYNPEENCEIPGLIDPIFEYSHASQAGASITGGYVYRGTAAPELYGKYIYGDFISKNIWALQYDSVNPPVNELITTLSDNITSFGTDQNNELYILAFSSQGGKIYKFNSATGADDIDYSEKEYFIRQAYPNPFNPSTTVSFYIPEASSVKIDAVNLTGETIALLKEETFPKGNHQLTWNAEGFSSGIYFLRFYAISSSGTRIYNNIVKAVLLK